MGSRGRVGAAIAALCVALAISGCGDEEAGNERSELAELLDHVPGGQPRLMFADFEAAKEQLGLPEDADVAGFPAGDEAGNVGRYRLAITASRILPYLSIPPRLSPLRKAIDAGAIAAAASNPEIGADGVAVIRTSQSFEEIAAALEGHGYTRDGNVASSRLEGKIRDAPTIRGSVEAYKSGERIKPAPLNTDFARQLSYPVVANAADGVIVLGFDRGTVEDTVTGSAGSEEIARELLEGVEGVARGARSTVVDSTSLHCVQGLAVGESFDPETAELRIEIDGEASADRFRLPEVDERPRLEYGEPEVAGDELTVEITGGRDPSFVAVQLPSDLLASALDLDRIYDC